MTISTEELTHQEMQKELLLKVLENHLVNQINFSGLQVVNKTSMKKHYYITGFIVALLVFGIFSINSASPEKALAVSGEAHDDHGHGEEHHTEEIQGLLKQRAEAIAVRLNVSGGGGGAAAWQLASASASTGAQRLTRAPSARGRLRRARRSGQSHAGW